MLHELALRNERMVEFERRLEASSVVFQPWRIQVKVGESEETSWGKLSDAELIASLRHVSRGSVCCFGDKSRHMIVDKSERR
jgi:hypothetical protein